MATLHSALTALGPLSYSEVPVSDDEAKTYLKSIFHKTQTILDSVPPPPIADTATSNSTASRSRSNTTTSTASGESGISFSASSARSDPLDSSNIGLQKEWGKPIKLSAKDNPHSIAVYKLGGKDGKGAWFARRSVHEGMGFKKWKLGLQREFPESLAVQGGPGEGNVRGIGGERRLESRKVSGAGAVEVYHLSAQFPGPTTPRDFVELLVTSDSAIEAASTGRHYVVISKPCQHPDCPQRDGFIRGQYESIEFIREIPRSKPRRSMSAADLRRAALGPPTVPEDAPADHVSESSPVPLAARTRARGQTISFAETRRDMSKSEGYGHPADDADESNPVEWIMVTRSDPGGSVPRFLVERGTPGGIVGDAGKWLQWAATKDHGPPDADGEGIDDKHSGLEAQQTNGHLAGLEEDRGMVEEEIENKQPTSDTNRTTLDEGGEPFPSIEEPTIPTSEAAETSTTEEPPPSLVSSAIGLARSSLETYAPKIVLDHLPRQPSPLQKSTSNLLNESISNEDAASGSDSNSTTSTTGSFVSVGDRFENDDDEERKCTTDATSSSQKALSKTGDEEPIPSIQEQQRALLKQASEDPAADPLSSSPELVKIRQRRKTLDTKFQQLKQKELEKILKEKVQPPALVAIAQQKAALAETKPTGSASAAPSLSSEQHPPSLDNNNIPSSNLNTTTTTAQQRSLSTSSSTSSPQKNEIPPLEEPLLDPETSLLLSTRLQKAHQKHARESAKQDLKYRQTVAKLASKREKIAAKEAARKNKEKTQDKDKEASKEKDKDDKYTALEKENQQLRDMLETAKEEAEGMKVQIRELQRENTGLVVGVGRLRGGEEMLREVRGGDNRRRSGTGGS